MMKQYLRIGTLTLLAMTLVVAMSVSVFAREASGKVTYDGSELKASYTQTEIQESFGSLLPGDEMTLTVSLVNDSDSKTSWYVDNTVTRAFEDNQKASGGAYTYSLSYVGQDGKQTVLYDSETIGGDDSSSAEGLHQVMSGSDAYLYLGDLEAGKTGKVVLKVAVDGETLNNDYQAQLATIDLNFGVDANAGGASGEPGKSTRTGDRTPLYLLIALFVVSGAALAFLTSRWFKTGRASHE